MVSYFSQISQVQSLANQRTGQTWQTITVPVVLLGMCYMIGVVYEVFDYWWPIKRPVEIMDDEAFLWALNRHSDKADKALYEWVQKCKTGDRSNFLELMGQIRCFKYGMWNDLLFLGGSKPEMGPLFAHCHRFQAEHKMFLHLIYPSMVFVALSFADGHVWQGFIGLGVTVMFSYSSRERNRRRWLQVLISSRRLSLRDANADRCFARS